MTKIKLMLCTIFMVILVTACSASVSTTPSLSAPACSNKGLNLTTFLTIIPEQTSQSDIENLLGNADGIEEPLLEEWTWVYLCDENMNTRFRVTYNTLNRPFKVSKLNYYNPKIDVSELINQFGSPELVYKEIPEIQQDEEIAKYTFAYPSMGLFASTISSSAPLPSNEVTEIYKEMPENTQQFLAEIRKRTDLEIVEWP